MKILFETALEELERRSSKQELAFTTPRPKDPEQIQHSEIENVLIKDFSENVTNNRESQQ